ncbi:hypothetical protein B566_EDAN005059 [Ephemera danica]|nr:hypothetical protein B566_EDAN005059 [Ephemera danica]
MVTHFTMVTLLFGPMLALGLLISPAVSTISRLTADVPPPDHFMQGLRFDNFDLRLCQTLYTSSPTNNVAVSPVSVKLVLAMLYEAARGDTAAEIQKSLDLPYLKRETRHKLRDNKYSMYIIIPHELNGLDDVLPKLTPDGIRDTIKEMETVAFTLLLPKFTFEFAVDLDPILKKLGINKIFSPDEAEFPLISNTTKVYISKILHKAGLEVNEYGSTVYAATQANMGTRYGGSEEVLKVDHPFLFFIKDDTAETIIFAAKVENPLTKAQATTTTTIPPTTKPRHNLVHSRLGEKNDKNVQTSPPNRLGPIITRINRPTTYYRIIQTSSRNQRQVRGFGGNPHRGYGTDFNPFGFNNFNIPQRPQPNFNVFPNYPFGQQGLNQNFGQFPGYNPGYPTQINNRRTNGWRPQVVPPRPPQVSNVRPPTPTVLSAATTPRTPVPILTTTPNVAPILTTTPTPGAPLNNLPAPDQEVIQQIFGTPPPSNSNINRPTTNRQNLNKLKTKQGCRTCSPRAHYFVRLTTLLIQKYFIIAKKNSD